MRQSMYLILLIFIGPLVAQGQETNAAIRKGNLLYKKGDYPHSIPEYRKAVELEPQSAYWKVSLAEWLQKAGQGRDAAQVLREVEGMGELPTELLARVEKLRSQMGS